MGRRLLSRELECADDQPAIESKAVVLQLLEVRANLTDVPTVFAGQQERDGTVNAQPECPRGSTRLAVIEKRDPMSLRSQGDDLAFTPVENGWKVRRRDVSGPHDLDPLLADHEPSAIEVATLHELDQHALGQQNRRERCRQERQLAYRLEGNADRGVDAA